MQILLNRIRQTIRRLWIVIRLWFNGSTNSCEFAPTPLIRTTGGYRDNLRHSECPEDTYLETENHRMPFQWKKCQGMVQGTRLGFHDLLPLGKKDPDLHHSGRGYSRIVRSESSCSYSVNEYHPIANWFILLYNDIDPSSHTSQISQCNHDSPSLRFSAIVSAKKHRNKNQARTEEIWERTASGSDHCVLIFETK